MNCCRDKKSIVKVKRAASLLKVISEENRLKILCLLQKQEMCVCEIWKCLNLPQNLVSHHLKVLKNYSLIDSRKEGTKLFYFLNKKNAKQLIFLKKLLK